MPEPTGDVVADAADHLRASGHHPTVQIALANLSPHEAPFHSAAGEQDDEELKWAALERLPTFERLKTAIINRVLEDGSIFPSEVNVANLTNAERTKLVELALETHDQDNEILLRKMRERMDRVGVDFPTVEVRFDNINIEAGVYVGNRALPTLINYTRNVVDSILVSLRLVPDSRRRFPILHNVRGVLKPGRMTLLLGPPGAGKSTLMKTLAGQMDKDLKFEGSITYNGHEMHEFIPVRTAAYVPQDDVHIGEMTVRETLDFSARVQGAGFRADMGCELERREKEGGIKPDATMDAFVKGLRVEGNGTNLSTDYILKVVGLDVCADTLVGNDMIRGISGGQKKRVTTGEMIVGPKQVLFADEISTGLDSSTTFNITKCLRNFTHFQSATVLVALLQPAPETYNLFDDVLLLAEGHVVFHGPLPQIVSFFETQGFYCPDRKGVADFLQEVTSVKDQEQYWRRDSPYRYVPVAAFSEAFGATKLGQETSSTLDTAFVKEKSHPAALVPPSQRFGLQRQQLFKALFEREWLLMKRNSSLYIAQTINNVIAALITATVFFRTTLNSNSIVDGNSYLGAIFFALISMLFNGFAEMSLLVMRLPVFYKQRDQFLFPAWAYAIPMWILSIPFSLWTSMVWCVLTYYVIGFSPDPERFFKQWLALFLIHQVAIAMFRNIGGVGRTMVVSNTFGAFTLIVLFCLGGFVIAKNDIPVYWIWGFWISPLAYGENALTNNEFTAPRWQSAVDPVYATHPGQTFGSFILSERSLFQDPSFYWIGVGTLAAYTLLFNLCLATLVLRFLNPMGQPQPVISEDSIQDRHAARTGEMAGKSRGGSSRASKRASGMGGGLDKFRGSSVSVHVPSRGPSVSLEGGEKDDAAVMAGDLVEGGDMSRKGMVLPFEPLSLSFHNVNYYVDMPAEMKVAGSSEDRLQLLRNVSGAFRPKVLTALVGVSGAGKTTLMDVLAGRKTGGYIEGDVRVSGYPKVQETFKRIAGYCEQNDIHSPQVTVHESLLYSAWLRLPAAIDEETREEFVEEVMELVELDTLRGALVGMPGVTGLSTEQRKRLTIAVELVANPSIIFMDEPTSGLDARAAAIVMRAVRNTVDTGRTVVCTIHQPSIDIFETFDELLLMKRGGQVIYMGPLGINSQIMVDYFQSVEGVPSITDGYNPATWMLEVSAPAAAEKLGVDFADVFAKSERHRLNEELINSLKTPPEGHADLYYESQYSTGVWTQFYACLWKRSRMYWRAPDYNVVRYFFCIVIGLLLGSVFFGLGIKRGQQQNVLNVMGALYTASLFLGWNNAASVQPIIGVERTVMYRERAAGLYAGMPYALAQGVIEIPYVFVQTILYSLITYALIHFEWTAPKFFWYTLYMFLTLLYFTYYGMMAIAITPNQQLAMVVSSFFFSLWNLFSGFLITRPNIPAWWRWFYFINPVAWTLYGLVTSQLGDVETTISQPGVSPDQSVSVYIHDYFGYDQSMLGPIVAILFAFVIMFFVVFAYAIQKINFQVR